jgi:hypothetical protein
MNPAVVGLISLGVVVFGVGMLSVWSGARQRGRADDRRAHAGRRTTESLESREQERGRNAPLTTDDNPGMAMAGATGANDPKSELHQSAS